MIGTKIIIDDQSYIPSLTVADSTIRPIVFAGFTSDKGTEEYRKWEGRDFFAQFGEISFARHGQPLLQAANVINNGGIVYAKRVVDPTAKMASLGVVAHVTNGTPKAMTALKKDEAGRVIPKEDGTFETEPVYWKKIDVDNSAMEVKDRPVYRESELSEDEKTTKVAATYEVNQINFSVETLDELNTNGANFAKNGRDFYDKYVKGNSGGSFPLFLLTDVGRGKSNKSITISLDSTLSRSAQSARYVIDITENNTLVESLVFSLDPKAVDGQLSLFIQPVIRRSSSQLLCYAYEDQFDALYARLTRGTNIQPDELRDIDILNMRNWKGEAVLGLEVLEQTQDGRANARLDRFSGWPLLGGDNGSTFGDAPITTYKGVNDTTSLYALEMEKVYNGVYNDDIYDVDNNPIDIVVDANYPHNVKRAIESLCTFRQDMFFFRDMGTQGLKDILSIKNAKIINSGTYNRFSADYCQYFDVIDPYTRKQVTVTIGYAIARLICIHFANGRSRVCAGISNNWTVPEIVEGTLSFVPKITPSGDQVAEMDETRINFGKYYNGTFSLATEYTSQTQYTQLSFINNVLSVQELIKQIRITCPKSRYKFITGSDFNDYKKDVQTVVDTFASKFASIEIQFNTDSVYTANKIVYATIRVSFKDFAQAEIFRIIAIPITTTASSSSII